MLSPPLESRVKEPDFRRAVFMFTRVSGRAGRAKENREVTLNKAESLVRKSPSPSPTPADYSHSLMEKVCFLPTRLQHLSDSP